VEEGERRLLSRLPEAETKIAAARRCYEAWQNLDLREDTSLQELFSQEELRISRLLLAFCLREARALMPGSSSFPSLCLPPGWLEDLLPWVVMSGRRLLFEDLWSLVLTPSWSQAVLLAGLHPDRPQPEALLKGKKSLRVDLSKWCGQGSPVLPEGPDVLLEGEGYEFIGDVVRCRDLLQRGFKSGGREVVEQILKEKNPGLSPLPRMVLEDLLEDGKTGGCSPSRSSSTAEIR
jgi:hypothetical protein